MRIPSWNWLLERMSQDEALDKLEDAWEARALKERAEAELKVLAYSQVHRN